MFTGAQILSSVSSKLSKTIRQANKEMRFGSKTDHSTYKAAEVKVLMGEVSRIPSGSPGVIVQQ